MGLRNYQHEDQASVYDHWTAGKRRLLGVQATGLGKTQLFSTIYNVIPKRKKMAVVVNREELVEQTAATITRENPGFFVGIEQAENRHSPFDDVVICSVQTIGGVKEGEDGEPLFNKRILSLNPDDFDLIIVDECLTGDSLIQTSDGLLRLDNSGLKDKLVLSYNEKERLWEYRRVVRWIKQGVKPTIKIGTKSGWIRCTVNHPIMTQRGWVEAGSLTQEDLVMLPQKQNGQGCLLPQVVINVIAAAAKLWSYLRPR